MSETTCLRTASARHPLSFPLCGDSPTGRFYQQTISPHLRSRFRVNLVVALLLGRDTGRVRGLRVELAVPVMCVGGVGVSAGFGGTAEPNSAVFRALATEWSPPRAVTAPHTRSKHTQHICLIHSLCHAHQGSFSCSDSATARDTRRHLPQSGRSQCTQVVVAAIVWVVACVWQGGARVSLPLGRHPLVLIVERVFCETHFRRFSRCRVVCPAPPRPARSRHHERRRRCVWHAP